MKRRRMPKGWTCYPDGGSDQNGEWQPSGSYTAKKVLWSGPHRYKGGNDVVLEVHIGYGASVGVRYHGEYHNLWYFKCRSNLNAIRKTEYRLRGQCERIVREMWRAVLNPAGWFAAYYEGVPFCSFYYRAYEVTNGVNVPVGKYHFVTPEGACWEYDIRGSSVSGTITKTPNPAFPNWITSARAA